MTVRITNAALDEHDGRIILRGSLDPNTLGELKTDDYQRQVRPVTSLNRIISGYRAGNAVPDVELGMRGIRKSVRDGVYSLLDDVYIIDGLQRISAAKLFLANGDVPHLGATIHFGTTRDWERQQFKILNLERTRVSSNVILNNFCEDFSALETLRKISADSEFAMRNRICWQQNLSRTQLVGAMTFCMSVIALHSNADPSPKVELLCKRVQSIMTSIGVRAFTQNVKAFYQLIDDCWDLNAVVYKEKAPFIRSTFLLTLSRMMFEHGNFWQGSLLSVPKELQKKLAAFPTFDPSVLALSESGSKVSPELYMMITDHLNKGKRQNRLEKRAIIMTPRASSAHLHSVEANQ